MRDAWPYTTAATMRPLPAAWPALGTSLDSALAQQLTHKALEVFEEGVRKHYYSRSEIEPIMTFIREHVSIKNS